MYFDKSFSLKRHSSYYKSFSDFLLAVKYYLKRYKNDPDIEISIDKDNFSITFTGKGNIYFY